VLFRKRLTRAKLLGFFAAQASCVVAMEACAGSHYRGRKISNLGHTVRLIPPAYVKPFVKRQKNDAADGEAICEAAQRPSMRFLNHTVAALADPAAYAILARPAAARLSARAYSVPSLSGGGAVATRSGPATRFCCSTNSLKSASRVAGSSGGAAAAATIAGTLSSAR
jgi:transposase